ncbi:DUF2997 domain-containing protein [Nocardia sp. NPDC050712]|uniref:DUF2997 domain-containing protein n=1 Tax=Nocardia sp. NPDC050712 TaxID=3155518 RepID=UPI0033F7F604
MSEPVRLTIVVGADGRIRAETHNVVGELCLPYVQALEDLLDATTVDSDYTADWWKTVAAQVNTDVQQLGVHE